VCSAHICTHSNTDSGTHIHTYCYTYCCTDSNTDSGTHIHTYCFTYCCTDSHAKRAPYCSTDGSTDCKPDDIPLSHPIGLTFAHPDIDTDYIAHTAADTRALLQLADGSAAQ
jgi:hypothetical protein